jgi:hypothetical protein
MNRLRWLNLSVLLTGALALAMIPEAEAQRPAFCPRGVQVKSIQMQNEKMVYYQKQQMQQQQVIQQRQQEVLRATQIRKQQQTLTAQTKQVNTARTAIQQQTRTVMQPVTRTTMTPQQRIIQQARVLTPTPTGTGGGRMPTPVTQVSKRIDQRLVSSSRVATVPVTERILTQKTRTATQQVRTLVPTTRETQLTTYARQVQTTPKTVNQTARTLHMTARSVHDPRTVTTLTWTANCMQCHKQRPAPTPLVQDRPRPMPDITRPTRPPQVAREPFPPRVPVQPVIVQLGPFPPTPLVKPPVRPVLEPVIFPPIIKPTPVVARPVVVRPIDTLIARPRPATTTLEMLETPKKRTIPSLLEPLTDTPGSRKGPDPMGDPIARAPARPLPPEALEFPVMPETTVRARDPGTPSRHTDEAQDDSTISRRGGSETASRLATLMALLDDDLQTPTLPPLPLSVLVLAPPPPAPVRYEDLDLDPDLPGIEPVEMVPRGVVTVQLPRPPIAPRQPAARLVTELSLETPATPALPSSILGPG